MYGAQTGSEGAFIDPEEFFKQQFGGQAFTDLIGEISIAKDFKEAMGMMGSEASPGDPNGATGSLSSAARMEERLEQREARVAKLACNLINKLCLYSEAFPLPPEPEPSSQPPPAPTVTSSLPSLSSLPFASRFTAPPAKPQAVSNTSVPSTTSQQANEASETSNPASNNSETALAAAAAAAKQEELGAEAMESFKKIISMEAETLKKESYGVELLHAIGFTYYLKAQQHSAKLEAEEGGKSVLKRAWGMGSHFVGVMREKAHIVNETVGTFKTALDLQSSFSKLNEMDKKKETAAAAGGANGGEAGAKKSDATSTIDEEAGMSQEERELRMKLEYEAASKGLEALWRGSKLEVEAVLREG
jgi:hypothetical protein